MRKLATSCYVIAILGTSFSASAMDQGHCLTILKDVSDAQLALAGADDLNQAISDLEALRDNTPSMQKELNEMLDVVKDVDVDSSMPAANIDMDAFDRADANFQQKYEQVCGEY